MAKNIISKFTYDFRPLTYLHTYTRSWDQILFLALFEKVLKKNKSPKVKTFFLFLIFNLKLQNWKYLPSFIVQYPWCSCSLGNILYSACWEIHLSMYISYYVIWRQQILWNWITWHIQYLSKALLHVKNFDAWQNSFFKDYQTTVRNKTLWIFRNTRWNLGKF